jgi:hypothetical protein
VDSARQGINVEILHAYDTLSSTYTGANPKTYVRRKGQTSDYLTFSGSAIKLAVKDLLFIAGVDLDTPYDAQPSGYNPPTGLQGVGTSSGKFPYPRLTGVRLLVEIKYYNYRLDQTESNSAEIGTNSIYAIVEVSPTYSWTSRGQDITYRTSPTDWTAPFTAAGTPQGGMEDMYVYGINVDISSTGNVAQFNFQLFIQTVIGGLVFLGTAKTVCDLVATQGLGVKSKLYNKFMREEVDLERECARFAIQALVATHFFHSKDEDGTGTLDLHEVQNMLREMFVKLPTDEGSEKADTGSNGDGTEDVLSDSEISSLALYILRSCDENRKENRLAGKESANMNDLAESSINLAEFISIFTEDNIDIKTLKQIVALTDLDEQVHAAEADGNQV